MGFIFFIDNYDFFIWNIYVDFVFVGGNFFVVCNDKIIFKEIEVCLFWYNCMIN